MLHVGIVGMGGIGNNHARCYTANENAKIVAVCDMVKEQADKAAASYEAQAFYSVEEMIASGLQLDACSVTTAGVENGGDHYEPTMALLRAGIPVLGEKPISNEIPKAREMVALAAEKKLSYGINLNHRFTPAAVKAKEWLTNGRLGELQMVNMTMWINNPNESSPWFHIRALHPHSLDVMSYFAGGVDRVHAFFKKGEGRQIWSNVQANLQYENGVIGHLTGSYDAGGSYGLETLELIGSEGRIIINEACEKLTFYPRFSREVESYDHLGGMGGFADTFPARINAWIDDLLNQVPPEQVDAKGADALRVQLVIEALIESWETGQVVKVPQQ